MKDSEKKKPYTPQYLASHCVDVFFTYNGMPIHILTYGNSIPSQLNDMISNRVVQQMIARKHRYRYKWKDLIINEQYLQRLIELSRHEERDDIITTDRSVLLSMFAPNASIGFYSYDYVYQTDDASVYMLVASPSDGVKVDSEVYEMLCPFCECEFIDNGKLLRIRE